MKLPLAYTLRNRYASTEQDARLLNGYAEVIRNKKDRRKIDKSRAIKRPGITAAFENLAGIGQALYTPFTPDNSGVPATVIADTLIRGMSSVASKLAFGVQPSNADLNTSFSPAVTVRIIDVFGNLVNSSANVTVSAYNNNTGATLGGTLTQGAAAGTATFNNLTLNRSGDFTLLAVSNALRDSISASFSINTKLVFAVQPVSTQPNSPIVVTVQSQDSAGNVDAAYNGQIEIAIYSGTGGTLFGTTKLDAINGEASFTDLSIDISGTYTLIATAQPSPDGNSANPASATSNSFVLAKTLVFTTQPSSASPNTAISPPVVITAKDGAGNTITTFTGNVTISIGSNPSGGTLSGTLMVSAIAGVATFSDLKINNSGSGYTLSAIATDFSAIISNSFDIAEYIVTAVQFTYSTDGPNVVKRIGYDLSSNGGGPYGGINPTIYLGNTLRTFQTYYDTNSSLDETLIFITGTGLTSNFFTSITINGFTLTSASASFTDLGTEAVWEWPGILALSVAGTYPMSIS